MYFHVCPLDALSAEHVIAVGLGMAARNLFSMYSVCLLSSVLLDLRQSLSNYASALEARRLADRQVWLLKQSPSGATLCLAETLVAIVYCAIIVSSLGCFAGLSPPVPGHIFPQPVVCFAPSLARYLALFPVYLSYLRVCFSIL